MKPPDTYISVRNWRKFQHYDPAKRRPVWIKTHLDLVTSDEYRDLSAGCRAVLHGIWIEYASTQCQLKFDAKSLSTRLNLRVTKRHLETLNHAGWIDIVASKTLADGYQDASPEVEVEVELEEDKPPYPNPVVDVAPNGSHTLELVDPEDRERILKGEGVLHDLGAL